MIIFAHIPKTGGTSFRQAAHSYYAGKRIWYDYGRNADLTSQPILQFLRGKKDESQLCELARQRNIALICGHFPFRRYANLFPDAALVTFVRDPLTRARSQFLHHQRLWPVSRTPMEFAQDTRFQEGQSSVLDGISWERVLIGITEKYSASIARINNTLDLTLSVRHANKRAKNQASFEFESDVCTQLLQANRLDSELYQWAKKYSRLWVDPD